MSNTPRHIVIKTGCNQSILLFNEPGQSLHIQQESNSSLSINIISLGFSTTHSITIEQIGEGANTDIYGLAISTDNQAIDYDIRVHHLVPNGSSSSLCKFILKENAKASFYGEVKVFPNAQHTLAKQTNRNILLSPTALMRTEPQLEIYADDVQCSHGATTGQLDDAAIFYMQQRGIDALTAKKMLIQAFIRDTYTMLDSDKINEIEHLIHTLL